MDYGLSGAHNDGGPIGNGYWTNDSGTHALITHNGDYLRGDGLQDMLARMPDGRFYMYPGDGYGSFDVSARLEVLLPADAPDPAALTEIKAAGDITGDGLPDLFANVGGQLWAFTGYTGGSFTEAELLCGCSGAWNGRDIVSVADVSGDGIADLVYRTHGTERLYLREGKPATAGGGVALDSLGTAAESAGGSDLHYGSGWSTQPLSP